jgi:hypothetical protein
MSPVAENVPVCAHAPLPLVDAIPVTPDAEPPNTDIKFTAPDPASLTNLKYMPPLILRICTVRLFAVLD